MKVLLAAIAVFCLAVQPVRAEDESALIASRNETREMAHDALATL
jgi:hypothetical protein